MKEALNDVVRLDAQPFRTPRKIPDVLREFAERCGRDSFVYLDLVTALKAHVVNGKIVVDETVDLPDGSEVRVYLYDAAAGGRGRNERR